ncbi:kti12, chromatin associated [Pestalotiopsis sp. IQ-011]
MGLTESNQVSIAELVIYLPALFVAIFLCVRHGFGRSSGWLYLIIFSLARIIGPSMQLATISQPRNYSLYIGAATLQSIGLSPLILVELGLLSRALSSIRKSVQTRVNENMLRVVQIVVLVGLILTSVGGSQAGSNFADTGVYTPSNLSQIGIGLMIAGFVLTVLAAAQVALQISHAEPGEKRLALAVGLSLPFVLVRLAYAAATVYSGNPKFNQLTGDVSVQIGMSVVMEMIAVAILEGFGLTLKKIPKVEKNKSQGSNQYEMSDRAERANGAHQRF